MRKPTGNWSALLLLAAFIVCPKPAEGCSEARNSVTEVLTSPSDAVVTARFGPAHSPVRNTVQLHTGWDYGAAMGDPVRAAAAGSVTYAGYKSGYGNIIIISHGDDLDTAYAHLRRIDLDVGTCVDRGNIVGLVGSTGLVDTPHLHFEVRKNGAPVDPVMWFRTQRRNEE